MESDTRMAMVPVPEDMVMDVYRFIVEERERRKRAAVGEQEVSAMQSQREPQRVPWSEADLEDVLKNGTRAVRLILPYLAKHPDPVVSGQELAELVYGPRGNMQQLGGALGSFTKTATTRYGHYNWPFEAVRNEEERSWDYEMDAETAERIRKLAGE